MGAPRQRPATCGVRGAAPIGLLRMNDARRTNRYDVAGWSFEAARLARPEGGLPDEPDCPPRVVTAEITVSAPPPLHES